jgi:hypothetical protein
MTNKPKAKGTAFETAVVKYLRAQYPTHDINRLALAGINDMGDIKDTTIKVIYECKAYKNMTRSLLTKWLKELDKEINNAKKLWDKNYRGYLVVKLHGLGIENSLVLNNQGLVVSTLDGISSEDDIIKLLAFGKERNHGNKDIPNN